MVFRNSTGKMLLSKFLGPVVEYLPNYSIIKGDEGPGYHEKLNLLTSQCNDFASDVRYT